MAFSSAEELEAFLRTLDQAEGEIPRAEVAKLLAIARAWKPASTELRYKLTKVVLFQLASWGRRGRLHRESRLGVARIVVRVGEEFGWDSVKVTGPLSTIVYHANDAFHAMKREGFEIFKQLPRFRKYRRPKKGTGGA
jgi:hypothetical protein